MACLFLTGCDTATDMNAPQAPNGNNMVAFYSVFLDSANRMHFYSSTDYRQSDSTIYYNSLYRGKWQYPRNIPVISFQTGICGTAMGSVLYDETEPFNGYKYIMYFTDQPVAPVADYWAAYGGSASCIVEEPSDVGAGLLYLSYSNNPDSGWTTPCQFSLDGSHALKIEEVSAIWLNGKIYLTVVEGDLSIPAAELNTETYAYMIEVDPSSPNSGTKMESGYFSKSGVNGLNPHITLTSPNTTDDNPMLLNLDTAFDPDNGIFYITRSYAYPMDAITLYRGEVPCDSASIQGMVAYPMRSQLYRMTVGNPPDFKKLYNEAWTLIDDYGNIVGYKTSTNGAPCVVTPLQSGQTNIGGNVSTMSILRTPDGSVRSSHQLILSYGMQKPLDNRKPYIIRDAW